MKTNNKFNYISAFLAFFLWGGWAYFVNLESGSHAIISFITQGVASFIITIFMIKIVTYFYNILPKKLVWLSVPAIFTISLTGSFLVIVHYLVGTRKILYTVSPALTIAFLFCLYTTYKLKKLKK